jgi:hypothetical protein
VYFDFCECANTVCCKIFFKFVHFAVIFSCVSDYSLELCKVFTYNLGFVVIQSVLSSVCMECIPAFCIFKNKMQELFKTFLEISSSARILYFGM